MNAFLDTKKSFVFEVGEWLERWPGARALGEVTSTDGNDMCLQKETRGGWSSVICRRVLNKVREKIGVHIGIYYTLVRNTSAILSTLGVPDFKWRVTSLWLGWLEGKAPSSY